MASEAIGFALFWRKTTKGVERVSRNCFSALCCLGLIVLASPSRVQAQEICNPPSLMCQFNTMGTIKTCERVIDLNYPPTNPNVAMVGSLVMCTFSNPGDQYFRARRPISGATSSACTWTFTTTGYNNFVECHIGSDDGLPVELMEFSVEHENPEDASEKDGL